MESDSRPTVILMGMTIVGGDSRCNGGGGGGGGSGVPVKYRYLSGWMVSFKKIRAVGLFMKIWGKSCEVWGTERRK